MKLTVNETTTLVTKAQNLIFCISCAKNTTKLVKKWKTINPQERKFVFRTLNILTLQEIQELKAKTNQVIVFNSSSSPYCLDETMMTAIHELAESNTVVFLNEYTMFLHWFNRSVHISVLSEEQENCDIQAYGWTATDLEKQSNYVCQQISNSFNV